MSLYTSQCRQCSTKVALAPELLTASPTGMWWWCPHCEQTEWDWVPHGSKRLWLIANGADWGAEDPLTEADVADFIIELAACPDPVGRLVSEGVS